MFLNLTRPERPHIFFSESYTKVLITLNLVTKSIKYPLYDGRISVSLNGSLQGSLANLSNTAP